MKNKRFLKELKSILYYVLEYGIKNISFRLNSTKSLKSERNSREFICKVHKGFMLAQNLIIQNLLLLGDEKLKTKEQIKILNKENNNSDLVKKLKYDLKTIEYQEKILRKVADTIAWQLLNCDIPTIRRLYNFSPQVEIFNSNLKHDLEVAEEIFNKNNESFPLITDITSFIQVGDLLVKDANIIRLIELKEGLVNAEISNIIDEYSEYQCDRKLYFELKDKDEKFRKQFARYIKQQATALNTLGIINNGYGTDINGRKIKISNDVFYTRHYDDVVESMLQKVNKKNYEINIIDGCLAIGVYNVSKIPIHRAFSAWKKSLGIDFPTIDIRSFINGPVAFPLFLHPFSIDDKIRLISGEKVIYMTLDIKKWLKMFEEKNVNVKLLSKKETARLNNVPSHLKAFEYNGQAIELEQGDIKQILYDGIFERMFNQFLKPSSAVEFLTHTITEGANVFIE
jgi:hypothetical protein